MYTPSRYRLGRNAAPGLPPRKFVATQTSLDLDVMR